MPRRTLARERAKRRRERTPSSATSRDRGEGSRAAGRAAGAPGGQAFPESQLVGRASRTGSQPEIRWGPPPPLRFCAHWLQAATFRDSSVNVSAVLVLALLASLSNQAAAAVNICRKHMSSFGKVSAMVDSQHVETNIPITMCGRNPEWLGWPSWMQRSH